MKRLFMPQRNKPALSDHLLPSFTKTFTVSKCVCVCVCVYFFTVCHGNCSCLHTRTNTTDGHANSRDSLRREAKDRVGLCKCLGKQSSSERQNLCKTFLFSLLSPKRTNTFTCPRSRATSGAPSGRGAFKVERNNFETTAS